MSWCYFWGIGQWQYLSLKAYLKRCRYVTDKSKQHQIYYDILSIQRLHGYLRGIIVFL
ncbi:hypothetical protein Ldro_1448 [Legionella drozanskii LLAP-1]|uniref:Uncharacterized protein n=1 Tax=Legionella drozanskii LLAP-1 TaxID=1212489 RepID=A0A0W0SY01_9GAMM|nr:hypothetical protein Ldro_1448 [Legionella drozanskii LLAP-1]